MPSATGPLGLPTEGAPPAPGRKGRGGGREGWQSGDLDLGSLQSGKLQNSGDSDVPGWVIVGSGWLWVLSAQGSKQLLTLLPLLPILPSFGNVLCGLRTHSFTYKEKW